LFKNCEKMVANFVQDLFSLKTKIQLKRQALCTSLYNMIYKDTWCNIMSHHAILEIRWKCLK
jgi:hypothetical protein